MAEPLATGPDLQPRACLDRTRSAVLNVLMAVALMIAVSAGMLRAWPLEKLPAASRVAYQRLAALLFVLGVASYASRRVLLRYTAQTESSRRETLFFWSHVVPAIIAALATPLGLYCGWFVDPRLGAVSPFWVVPLALGFLAFPREHELEVFHPSASSAGAHDQ
jgi:hypothetical protein